MDVREIICVGMAYLLGGFCTGYYLVKFRRKIDIRSQGSGGVGARNVGRVLGRSGFLITLLGDALKGCIVVVAAHAAGVSDAIISGVVVAVIAGHIWPAQLQFRGGRGIATATGAVVLLDPLLALVLLGLTGGLLIFRRGVIFSGLFAFFAMPLVAYALERPEHWVAALTGISIMILFAHRAYIRTAWGTTFAQREV